MGAAAFDPPQEGPLAGLRVIEVGSFIAAPLTATLLADRGADVIKVEPVDGDPARRIGTGGERAMSATFLASNRGKRSIALDLGSAEGARLLRDLVDGADVLVHNQPSSVARRLGIDEDALASRVPHVVSCRITAFGDVGPLAGRRGLDPIVQAMTGLASMNGDPAGEPTRCAAPVVDVATALAAAGAITAALVGRAAGRPPVPLTLALYDIALMLQSPMFPLRSLLGHAPPRLGNGSYALLGDQFATRDGFLALVVWDEARWGALCRLLALPGLERDGRFATAASRLEGYAELRPYLAEAISTWDARELEGRLLTLAIPCGVTAGLDEVAGDPHATGGGALYDELRCDGPAVQLVGAPVVEGRVRQQATAPPPALGAQGREVLRGVLELDADRIDELERRGAVRLPPGSGPEATRTNRPTRGAPA